MLRLNLVVDGDNLIDVWKAFFSKKFTRSVDTERVKKFVNRLFEFGVIVRLELRDKSKAKRNASRISSQFG